MSEAPTDLLLLALGETSAPQAEERLARLPTEDWHALVASARHHYVTPLLYQSLKRLRVALPAALDDELRQAFLRNAGRNLGVSQQLAPLLATLREKKIPVIALKGLHLAHGVYEIPALRIVGDVDLLIQGTDLQRQDSELLALGAKRLDRYGADSADSHHFQYTLPSLGPMVEMHWALCQSSYPFAVDAEGLWARAHAVRVGHETVLSLSPADLLLHLCLHAAKDLYSTLCLRMLCDMQVVIRRFGEEIDWQEVGRRAREWRVERPAYVFLRLARDLLGVAVPPEWLTSLDGFDQSERYLGLARREILAGRNRSANDLLHWVAAAQLQDSQGLRHKLGLIRRSLLPSREVMSLMYPPPADSWRVLLYYPLRLRDVLVRHGAGLWRLARGDEQTHATAARTNQVTALHRWLLSR